LVAERSGRKRFDGDTHGGLQAGEREVAPRPALHRPREGEARGIARRRGALDGGAAGIAETDHLGDLVEGFAGRIIDGGAEAAVASDAFDGEQLTMPAGDEEQKEWEFD